jgi:ketoreductase RED2
MKSALITGGSSGIGAELVGRFSRLGYRVDYTSRQKNASDDRDLVDVHQLDVCSEQSVIEFCNGVVNSKKKFDLIVLNAGYTEFVPLDETFENLSPELFSKIISANLIANYNLIYRLKGCLTTEAHVVLVSSVAAFSKVSSNLAYTLSKNAIKVMTAVLPKTEFGCIRYNAVAPGLMNTKFTASFPKKYFDENMLKTPLGRLANPSDIADVVECLQSSMKFVNGQTILIDGGFY